MEGSDLLTVSVPPEQVTRVRDALRELRRTKTGSSGEELAWLERLIADLEKAPRQRGTVDLTGPHDLLHESLLVAIDEAGDNLSERCTDLLRGAGSSADIRADVRGLDQLFDLLDVIEETGSS